MIRYFAAHPTGANLLLLFLTVLGLSALPSLKRETFPDFTPKEIEVRVPYPGASAEDVEEALCRRLEDAIDVVSDVAEVRCQALESVAIAVAKMTHAADFSRFLDDIKSEVEAIDDFPEQVELPVIRQLGRMDQVVSIAVTGPMSTTDLKAYAEELKDRIKQLPTVSQVTISGFSQHQLQVRVSKAVLKRHELGISDLANAISRQSIDLPAGTIETRDRDYLVRFTDQRRSLQKLEDLIVIGSQKRGGEIRLGDIADVTDRFELDEDKVLFKGERAALLQITKTKAEDTLDVVKAIKTFIEQERQRAPPGVRFTLTQDISSIVSDRLRMLVKNGLQGLILVFLVMWLFFQIRFAFWVAMGLPVSFLGGLFLMFVFGQSINMISMVALLIGVGLLMDDAIVIAENIAAHLKKGKSALDAAIDGTQQVMPGVVSSFLTTTAVFTPLAFLTGDIGNVLKVLPVVLISVLSVSLIEAFLILPHHLEHSLRHQHKVEPSKFRIRFDASIEWLRHEIAGKFVDIAINWRYLFVGSVIALFLGTLGIMVGGHLKFQAFPDIEGDVIQARILLPQGTPLWRTESIVAQLVSAVKKVDEKYTPQQPDGKSLVEDISGQYNVNLDAYETGPHVATVTADLLTAEERRGRIENILQEWREQTGVVPDVISLNYKEPQIGPAGLDIEIRLQGSELHDLKSASLELQHWLGQYRGVQDISDDLRPGKPELRIRLREGSYALGLDAATIANQIRAGFYGTTADEMQVGVESYEIDVGLSDADKNSLDDLYDFRIVTASGDQVPLGTVTDITLDRGFARIHRINNRRTVTVTGDVDTQYANAQQVVNDTKVNFIPDLLKRYPTVSVALEGQAAESAETGSSMIRGFSIGLVAIFILLSFQFRSYIEPLAVMAIIPLGFIGVVWGHIIMGLELSMPSMMGAISLSGIVVNDSILLVEFLKLRAREGHTIPEAAKMASRERFRAILLTSLTTVAGLTPLLAEKSLQAQVLIPLATSIVFGLVVATTFVIFVVPALFSIFSDFGWVSMEKEIAKAQGETELATNDS
jgi:hydrophobic/amphiphilic exporter-1 (mainly G- bacteria), HAE1 family